MATPTNISVKLWHLNMPLQVWVDNKHSGEPNTTIKLPFKTCWIVSGSSTFVMAIAGIPILFKYKNWSSISERKGEMTTTTLEPRGLEWTISATIGRHWKINDFPKPVGRLTKTSLPSKKALIDSRCSGRMSDRSNCFFTASNANFHWSPVIAAMFLIKLEFIEG